MTSAPPPMVRQGPLRHLRRELFASRLDGLISVGLITAMAFLGLALLRWVPRRWVQLALVQVPW